MKRATMLVAVHWISAVGTLAPVLFVLVAHLVPGLGGLDFGQELLLMAAAGLALAIHVIVVQARVGAEGGEQ